ncbi:MAG: putative protease [Parcubacteria group bacterium Gr01-1014_48]|nr:MAG: putative protease [Parcubacteria group bacterium Greene0416_14]TSC73274.1 MAG: putative protease [Parcubacteria group bacterium Gr01-1014_48]TSD01656.1 MAG: putative protease [Parcubacteria group bacterium Greene1014_15]TSD07753.1 MAG: putative protease [Parcubacteria group bacterium Greene0714_4]
MLKKQVAGEGFSYIQSSDGIDEFRLDSNGLRVLFYEDHAAPVVNVMVTYHVGSRNEAAGYTGATHLLEHLMFKGSKNFNKKNKKQIWNLLEARGARMNASTWFDRTNYYEVLPSEYLEDALAIEADRMRYAFIREEDRASEMTVVRNEFEWGENSPFEALDKNIWATAYQAHPYHHSTIGWRSDIENVSIKRLKEFYDTFYWPNNATLTVIGDFEPRATFELIAKHFGKHKKSPVEIPIMYTTEPKQEGQRRVVVSRNGTTRMIGIAHKTPEGKHRDTYALQILASVLGRGRTSRLYRLLIDTGRAANITPWAMPLHDNGLFMIFATLTPKATHEDVENMVIRQYKEIKNKGVTEAELVKAQTQVVADVALARDGYYNISSALNESIAMGDWTFYTTFKEKILGVTLADVLRVANAYLREDQSTVGYFIPQK